MTEKKSKRYKPAFPKIRMPFKQRKGRESVVATSLTQQKVESRIEETITPEIDREPNETENVDARN